MEEKTLPKLRVSKEEADEKIQVRIETGEQLKNQHIDSDEKYEQAEWDFVNWSKYNVALLAKLFDNSSIALEYKEVWESDSRPWYPDLDGKIYWHQKDLTDKINYLVGIQVQLELFDELSDPSQYTSGNIGTNIFIGHGRSQDWRELKDFISERLKLPYDEFNRVPVAGITNITRLTEMLDNACMAFLVMTAEDEQSDGTLHPRENVVHEAGLFQGRLGFDRAIILLEDKCEEFSNIHGLGQIRFSKGNMVT